MIYTHSIIKYGYLVEHGKNKVYMLKGNSTYEAILRIGSYSRDEFIEMVNEALYLAGVSVRLEEENQNLKYSNSDYTIFFKQDSIENVLYLEKEYRPPFLLQSFVSDEDNMSLRNSILNTSGSGAKELIYFGEDREIEFNIQYEGKSLNEEWGVGSLEGLAKLRELMAWAVRGRKIMFFPDENSSEYKTLTLKKSSSGKNSFKLFEMYSRGLRDIFETKTLTWRVHNDG